MLSTLKQLSQSKEIIGRHLTCEAFPVLLKNESGQKIIFLPCKSPRCPVCSKAIISKIKESFLYYPGQIHMITLTVAPENYKSNESYEWLSKYWDKFNKLISARSPDFRSSPWIRCVEEGGRNGRLHIHLIIKTPNSSLPFIIANSWEYGLRHIVTEDPNKGSLVNYFFKYIISDYKSFDGTGYISKSRTLSSRIKQLRSRNSELKNFEDFDIYSVEELHHLCFDNHRLKKQITAYWRDHKDIRGLNDRYTQNRIRLREAQLSYLQRG